MPGPCKGPLWRIVLVLASLHAALVPAFGQQVQSLVPSQQQERPASALARSIFQAIENGILKGDVGTYAEHFAGQVQLNLRGDQGGYFSARQAYYIMDNYFRTRKAANFHFSTIADSEATPYATGSGTIVRKGTREVVQVYVLLGSSGERWTIAQLNIY